jgi:hypothetical protein
MPKRFVKIVLLGIIILSFGYSSLIYLSHDVEDNFFNLKYRDKFAASEFWRNFLDLSFDGDAKSDFLGKTKSKILIEVDSMEGIQYSLSALDNFRHKVEEITHKETTYLISDQNIPLIGNMTEFDMEDTINRYRDFSNTKEVASLYILYSSYAEDESEIGSTLMESGIIIFLDSLEEFTPRASKNFASFEFSTLLHEFGHQLGLGHNEQGGCLMNEEAEVGGRVRSSQVITDFCEFEKQLILEIQQVF